MRAPATWGRQRTRAKVAAVLKLGICASVVFVVVALCTVAHLALERGPRAALLRQTASELDLAGRTLDDARRLTEASLLTEASSLAADRLVRDELDRLQQLALASGSADIFKDQTQRARLFSHLVTWRDSRARELAARYGTIDRRDAAHLHEALRANAPGDWWGAAPDLVLAFVTMPLKGERVAQVLVTHAERGQELAPARDHAATVPILSDSRTPTTRRGVITWNVAEYDALAVPVFGEGERVVGTLVVGYQLDSSFADRLAAATAGTASVAVYSGERLYAGSALAALGAPAPGTVARYARVTGGEPGDEHDSTLLTLEPGAAFVTGDTSGKRLLVQRVAWDAQSGVALVRDLEPALEPLATFERNLWLCGALVALLALGLALFVLRRHLAPLEALAVSAQELAAGHPEQDLRPRAGHPLHAALAVALEQLAARTSRSEAGATADALEEAEHANWQRLMVDLEPERPSAYGLEAVAAVTTGRAPRDERRVEPNAPAAVDADGADERWRTLYETYMARRDAHGQPADMDFARFCRRVARNEAALKARHAASAVEFTVATADGKVVLKPTLRFD